MSLQKDFSDMVAEIRKQRDSLISDIEEITNRYQEKETKIQGAFGGVLLEEKLTRMNREKQAETKKAIIYFQGATLPLFDQIERKIDLFIKMSSFDALSELERLSAIPMTKGEFRYVAERYGCRNYWGDRYLFAIAHKNGIEAVGLTPCVDTMLGIVKDLNSRISAFVEVLENGQEPLENILTDVYLSELSDRFAGNVAQEGK